MKRGWKPRLPTAALRGRFAVTEPALRECEQLLPTYRGVDGDHEGIVFLCGYELGDLQILTTAVAPNCDHGRGHVRCSERQIEEVVARAHASGLGVLAQVHTHPSGYTEHSVGDDEMVLMPYDGMLSIVVPFYARYRMRPLENLGIHQFQDGRWLAAERSTIASSIAVVPASVDLR